MAINGLSSYGSYGMGYYNYQSSVNNIRLAQALSKNPRFAKSPVSPVSAVGGSLQSSMNFIKKYSSNMSELMNTANTLRTGGTSGTNGNLKVGSSNESVATATERMPVRSSKEMTLKVSQLAQAQTNTSTGVKSSDKATKAMNFTVGNGTRSVSVNVSATNKDGAAKTNKQMLQEAADQINSGNANVRATVKEKDGNVSLELTGKYTGAYNGFNVTGETGAAEGLDKVQTGAADSKYSVTVDGVTTDYESYSNDIALDSYRISATLKSTGETKIGASVNIDPEKTVKAVGDLVDAYNSSIKLLNDNYGRGTGVDRQLRNLVNGLGSEKSLEKLGITVNKDATLKFDEDVLKKTMKEDPFLAKELISGSSGIANRAFSKAQAGLNVSSSSLINKDIDNAQVDAMTSNPYQAFSMYSRSGAYNMNNYAALGMMMNYLV